MNPTQVMVVEDEALVGIDIQNNLTNYGYNVVNISCSGREAIHEAVKIRPEIVLMDIHLKGEMDGIETAKFLRKTLGIPVIYLTAFSDDKTLTKALKASPYGYLLKPFVPRELHTSIQAALYRSEDEQKNKLERLKYLQSNIVKRKDLQAKLSKYEVLDNKVGANKKLDHLRYIQQNILRRNAFEAKLQEQSNFFQKLRLILDNFFYIQNVENTANGIFSLEEFASVLGYSQEEIIKMGNLIIPILIHPDDYPKMTDFFQKTILGGDLVYEIEFRLKHRDGSWKWFSNRSTFLDDEGGSKKKTLNAVREITSIKNLEESLLVTQEKLQAISSNPYLGFAILDLNGKILDINTTLERLSGYSKNELSWLNNSHYMSTKGMRLICEQLEQVKSGKVDSFQIETVIYPKYSGAFWCYMVFSVIKNSDGRREFIVCSLIDISETKLFEKAKGTSPISSLTS